MTVVERESSRRGSWGNSRWGGGTGGASSWGNGCVWRVTCVHMYMWGGGGVVSVRIERDVKDIYIMQPRQKTVASFPGSPGSGRGEPGNEAKNTVQYSGILLTHTGAVVCFV